MKTKKSQLEKGAKNVETLEIIKTSNEFFEKLPFGHVCRDGEDPKKIAAMSILNPSINFSVKPNVNSLSNNPSFDTVGIGRGMVSNKTDNRSTGFNNPFESFAAHRNKKLLECKIYIPYMISKNMIINYSRKKASEMQQKLSIMDILLKWSKQKRDCRLYFRVNLKSKEEMMSCMANTGGDRSRSTIHSFNWPKRHIETANFN